MEGLESNSAFYFFTQKTVIIAHLTLAHYRCVCPTTLTYLSATPGFLILILCIFLLTSHLNLLLTLIIHTCQTPNKLICPMKYHFESIRASPMYCLPVLCFFLFPFIFYYIKKFCFMVSFNYTKHKVFVASSISRVLPILLWNKHSVNFIFLYTDHVCHFLPPCSRASVDSGANLHNLSTTKRKIIHSHLFPVQCCALAFVSAAILPMPGLHPWFSKASCWKGFEQNLHREFLFMFFFLF